MSRTTPILLFFLAIVVTTPAHALNDQGLSSVMSIIDKAITAFGGSGAEGENDKSATAEPTEEEQKAASTTVVNLSRTLGKLSYSRLQCGEADVLAEFTRRVQMLPAQYRDAMRDAFQLGFDQSKEETPLLSEDECKRLTASRKRDEDQAEDAKPEEEPAAEEEAEPEIEVDPKLTHLRVAELTGQLAYKRKFCGDQKVTNRDYNEVLGAIPEEYRAEAKDAYWKGYQRGKRLNKGLTMQHCN